MTTMPFFFFFFFFNDTATTEIYTLSLHDALPISSSSMFDFICMAQPSYRPVSSNQRLATAVAQLLNALRSEEHTSELQSHSDIVCRLLLEKKRKSSLCERKPGTLTLRSSSCCAS